MNIYYLKKFRKLAKKRLKLVYYTNRVIMYYYTNSLWDMTLGSKEQHVYFRKDTYQYPRTYISEAQSLIRRMMREEILIRARQIPKKKRKENESYSRNRGIWYLLRRVVCVH